jgi:nucleotide-binding universal stress UspA family protein
MMSPYDFTNVLAPIDGSRDSDKALDCALSICSAVGARLTVLGVEGRLARPRMLRASGAFRPTPTSSRDTRLTPSSATPPHTPTTSSLSPTTPTS